MTRSNRFPPGWDEQRVQKVLAHHEAHREEQALSDDDAAFESSGETVMAVPVDLVPAIRALIAKHRK